MFKINTRITRILKSKTAQGSIFCALCALTLFALARSSGLFSSLAIANPVLTPPSIGPVFGPNAKPSFSASNSAGVKLQGALSQKKLVQGTPGVIYLELALQTPEIENLIEEVSREAVDMVVVLDKSGSMSSAKKMSYAKAAIKDILDQLDSEDRFALVAFSSGTNLTSPLRQVTDTARESIKNNVNRIRPSGGTNMSAGLHQAQQLLKKNRSGRKSSILLLSDGIANEGISSVSGLSEIASSIAADEAVLSTVGMGLDFRETTMTAIADNGMGTYSFLEDVADLGSVLAKTLKDTRALFANASELQLETRNGIRITDAAGYPIKHSGGTASVPTGRLLSGSTKKLTLTIHVPTSEVGDFNIGQVSYRYSKNGAWHQIETDTELLQYAVLEKAKRAEAVASIDKRVYLDTFLRNNWGRAQAAIGQAVGSGNKTAALNEINKYRSSIQQAEAQSGMTINNADLEAKLQTLEKGVNSSFAGSAAEQSYNRKGFSKLNSYNGRQSQQVYDYGTQGSLPSGSK